jgi:uncharacterized protein (DUF3820 family)
MSANKTCFAMTMAAGLAALAFGCKETTPQAKHEERQLTEIHQMYVLWFKRNNSPPKQLSDFEKKEFEMSYPVGYKALKDGKYIGVYGVSGTDSSTLQAYAKDVPTQGGLVVMADGTIKTMSVDEFKTTSPGSK